jgi:glutaminyl-peptide cyclotransferase
MIMRLWTRCCYSLLAIALTISFGGCSARRVAPPIKPPRFNQEKAYARLLELCSLGPRNHGSPGKEAAEKLIQRVMSEAGAEISLHQFEHTAAGATEASRFTNIVARIRPQEKRRVLIGTHYDTRSWADRDPRVEKQANPIQGANDGGSGVALLLEMALTWKDQPPPVGIDLMFFDGEDFGRDRIWDDYFLGSKAWVRDHPDYKAEWGVIVDMVGDASLSIKKERDSLKRAPAIVAKLWEAAERVKSTNIVDAANGHIMDDQTAFLNNDIPVILIIDLDYPWFHTTDDTPDKCSPESLGQVGRAVMEAVESS